MSPLLRIVMAAIAVLVYYVVTQIVLGVTILAIFSLAGKSVPGYHEPASYTWWTWMLFALWIGGGLAVGWWVGVRWPRRRARPAG